MLWLTCGISFSAFVYFACQSNWLGLGIDLGLDTPIYEDGAIVKIDPVISLIVVLGTLTVASALSVLFPAKKSEAS